MSIWLGSVLVIVAIVGGGVLLSFLLERMWPHGRA